MIEDNPTPLPVRFSDKEGLRQAMKQLLAALNVEGDPVSVEQLRREMETSGLEPNELSRSLIEARDK